MKAFLALEGFQPVSCRVCAQTSELKGQWNLFSLAGQHCGRERLDFVLADHSSSKACLMSLDAGDRQRTHKASCFAHEDRSEKGVIVISRSDELSASTQTRGASSRWTEAHLFSGR